MYHLNTCHLLATSSFSFIIIIIIIIIIIFLDNDIALHITDLQSHFLGLHFSNMHMKKNFQKLDLNNKRTTI